MRCAPEAARPGAPSRQSWRAGRAGSPRGLGRPRPRAWAGVDGLAGARPDLSGAARPRRPARAPLRRPRGGGRDGRQRIACAGSGRVGGAASGRPRAGRGLFGSGGASRQGQSCRGGVPQRGLTEGAQARDAGATGPSHACAPAPAVGRRLPKRGAEDVPAPEPSPAGGTWPASARSAVPDVSGGVAAPSLGERMRRRRGTGVALRTTGCGVAGGPPALAPRSSGLPAAAPASGGAAAFAAIDAGARRGDAGG